MICYWYFIFWFGVCLLFLWCLCLLCRHCFVNVQKFTSLFSLLIHSLIIIRKIFSSLYYKEIYPFYSSTYLVTFFFTFQFLMHLKFITMYIVSNELNMHIRHDHIVFWALIWDAVFIIVWASLWMRIHFWTFYPVPLLSLVIHVPIPYSLVMEALQHILMSGRSTTTPNFLGFL